MAKKSMIAKANRPPKFKVRGYNRCRRCGRSRAFIRKFGMCRICVRELTHRGELPRSEKGILVMVTDPISDMLTRIRNANLAMKETVTMPSSKLKEEVAKLLASEGYVGGFEVAPGDPGKDLTVSLRYTEDRQRVLKGLRRISKPGRRLYSSASDLPRVQGGLGVTIVSTSQGLLVDRECRRRKLGGEIICEVW